MSERGQLYRSPEYYRMKREADKLTKQEQVNETMNYKRFHVVVAMKPLVFDDDFPRKPDKNKILELVRDKLQDGEVNDNFVVVVEAKKET